MGAPTNSAAAIRRQIVNEWTAIYFALSMAGLLTLCVLVYWTFPPLIQSQSKIRNRFAKNTIRLVQLTDGLLLRKVPVFPSLGHAVVFLLYIAANLTLSFYSLDWSNAFGFARRMGWISSCNIALLTFLGLKNTPLSFLAGASYDRINQLHQVAGYCTILFATTHAVTYIVGLSKASKLDDLLELDNVMGIVAGISMLVILATALILRGKYYEIFYSSHIILFVLILITVGMHRPDLAAKALIMIIVAASGWVADRFVRFIKLVWLARGNHATVTALSQHGVRLALGRWPGYATPGTHIFLWIPQVRMFETHPFTIVSTNPLEVVVSPHSGFTKDLLSHAVKNPGATLRASIDGPYGALPNFLAFDNVILIAGGTGASFTFGIALNLIKHRETSSGKPTINFIWAVRKYETLSMYRSELDTIQESASIKPLIHLTGSYPPADSDPSAANLHLTSAQPMTITSNITDPPGTSIDEEKCGADSTIQLSKSRQSTHFPATLSGPDIYMGRPDVAELIHRIANNGTPHRRIMVAVCGPQSLMLSTRKAVVDVIGEGNACVTLHCEQFGW